MKIATDRVFLRPKSMKLRDQTTLLTPKAALTKYVRGMNHIVALAATAPSGASVK